MLAHPSAISSLSLLVLEQLVRDHDALDLARALVDLRDLGVAIVPLCREVLDVAVAAKDLHALLGGAVGHLEGVCAVVWSPDGRWVVSGGGDGVVKVFAR